MENYNASDLYKSVIEKNAEIIATVLAEMDSRIDNAENLALSELYESKLQLCTLIEVGLDKRRSDPLKIVDFLHHNRKLCKNYRDRAVKINDSHEVIKYQGLINEVVNPLIDSCAAVLKNQLSIIPHKASNNIEVDLPIEEANEGITKCTDLSIPNPITQIVCKAKYKQILFYFMILAKEENPATKKPYMTRRDVIEFVKLNFAGCGTPGNQKYFEIGTEVKSTLTYFILQFYQKYGNDRKNSKMQYVQLLISNFKMFADVNPISLLSNMNPSKIPDDPDNIINTKKYFPKK